MLQHDVNGNAYYTFEFIAQAPNYTRHALSTISIGNGMKISLQLASILSDALETKHMLYIKLAVSPSINLMFARVWSSVFWHCDCHFSLQVSSTLWPQEPTKGGGIRWKKNCMTSSIPSQFPTFDVVIQILTCQSPNSFIRAQLYTVLIRGYLLSLYLCYLSSYCFFFWAFSSLSFFLLVSLLFVFLSFF